MEVNIEFSFDGSLSLLDKTVYSDLLVFEGGFVHFLFLKSTFLFTESCFPFQ